MSKMLKSLGIVRKVDSLGRIVIPKELRTTMNIVEDETVLEISSDGEKIVLSKYNPGCHCCGNVEGLKEVMGLKICPDCLKEFSRAIDLIEKSRMREGD